MSQPQKLPPRPDHDWLRKTAKQRLKVLRPSQPDAKLADAQRVVAAEFGFVSWPKLVDYVQSVRPAGDDPRGRAIVRAANDADLDHLRTLLHHQSHDRADLTLALGRVCLRAPHLSGRWEPIALALVDAGADPRGEYGGNYGPILLGCCENLSVDGARFLLDRGADPGGDESRRTKYPDSNTPLRMALGCYLRERRDDKHRLIDLLIERGASRPTEVNEAALAVLRGDPESLARAIDSNPACLNESLGRFPYGNVLLNGATLLHLAVEFGQIECVDELIRRNADLNAPAEVVDGVGGQTPVFHAIRSFSNGCRNVLRHLLDRHAGRIDWSVRATFKHYEGTQGPFTPLQWAQSETTDSIEYNWIVAAIPNTSSAASANPPSPNKPVAKKQSAKRSAPSESGTKKPGAKRAVLSKSVVSKPNAKRTILSKPVAKKQNATRSAPSKSGTNKPGGKRTILSKSGTTKPGAKPTVLSKSGTRKPSSRKPELTPKPKLMPSRGAAEKVVRRAIVRATKKPASGT